jgi:hypothetical protein
MNTKTTLLAVAVAAALAACGQQNDSPVRTTSPASGTTSESVQATAPAAQSDRDTPPRETPSTHAGAPQPEATAAPTARDTPAQKPASDLTPAEESKAMPKPGQTDNHFTPSIDGQLKGTQQSPGTPSGASPSTATPSK